MGALQDEREFLRTRRAVQQVGVATLGPDHLDMVDRLSRKDDRGRELGAAQHRRLAMEVTAGAALIRCAELAARLAPGIDWIEVFTAAPAAPEQPQEQGNGTSAATDRGGGSSE